MKVSDLVGREYNELTKKEIEYLLSTEPIKNTILYNENECVSITEFSDGSFTKTFGEDDTEVASSIEELQNLINSGKYTVEEEKYETD